MASDYDAAAATAADTPDDEDGALAALDDLQRAVMEAYVREADSSSHYEQKSSSMTLSVKDLVGLKQLGRTTARHSTLLLEVLEEWRKLISALKNDDGATFLPYVTPNLWTAFRNLRTLDPAVYRHLKTLLGLLTNTVVNRKRDNSTECRFVTLLEVVLSYDGGKTGLKLHKWKPSEEVQHFWVRLMQRISTDIAPITFRRKAYRVLVSLSWVPSSKGLLEACSFEASRQTIDPSKSPPKVRAYLTKIRDGKSQPRYDCVNQILDRLKDETDVCVAITSDKEGMGKTTMAALVASHPSILRVFKVLWLSIPDHSREEEMSYETYIKCLDDLCEQLGFKVEWPECVKRFEEPALRRLREDATMQLAREMVSEALLERDENCLLVLDDIVDARKIDWFRFNERQSIIVTTPHQNLDTVDWTVDLGPMGEEEAIDLFLCESGFSPQHVLGLTVEVRALIRKCECHPLTIRTVARWYKLKVVTAGIVGAMEELVKGFSSLQSLDDKNIIGEYENNVRDDDPVELSERDSVPLLFDVLSLMMGPTRILATSKNRHHSQQGKRPPSTSILFVLCLSATAVVFPNRTPLDSLILLWEQLLKVESHAIDEMSHDKDPTPADIRHHVWLIAEGLQHMGVLNIVNHDEDLANPWVEIHHKLYRDFAMYMAHEMDLADTYEQTVQQWNRAFVTAYFTQRIEGNSDGVDDNSWEYAIERLPSHVFQAKMFPMAETILGEEHFFRARIESMGWDRAVDVHIHDCVLLQLALVADERENDSIAESTRLAKISPVWDKTATIIATQAKGALVTSEESFINEVSRALFKIGVALAENGYYTEAVAQFETAQNLLPQSQELRARILYGAGWALLATNKTEKALKKIKASVKVMEEYVVDHVLYEEALQLQGECLVGECSYKAALEFFEEVVMKMKNDPSRNKIELGTTLYKEGRLLHTMGDLIEATVIFKECLNWKTDIGEKSRDLALVYSSLGDISMEKRNNAEARERYESSMKILDSLGYDPESLDHALVIGKLRFLRSDFTGSFESLEIARRAINCSPVLFMDQSAYDLRCIARILKSRGETSKAISVLQESLALTSERPYSLERSSGLHELANCFIDQDNVKEGLVCLEQSLEIRILKLGECVQVLDTLSAIGNVHLSLGAYEESLAVFEKVKELTLSVTPNDVERIAGVLYSIGEVYDAKKDYSEAITKFDECMAVLKRDRSSDHPHVAKALQRLGDVTVAQKDFDGAFDYYCEALRIRKMGFNDRELAETLFSIGVLTRKRKQLEAAREPLFDALEIRRNHDNGRETCQTLLEIGNVFRLQNQPEDAVSIFEKALDILDDEDDIYASVYLCLGHAKLSLKKDDDVLDCYERARDIRLAAYGKDNMKTGNVHRSLGILKFISNHGDDALVHLNEFIRVIELNDEEENEEEGEDMDYVLAITLMFDIHQAHGRTEQAKGLIDVAKEVCDESEEVRELPALVGMVERRWELSKDPKRRGGGLMSRLKLSEEAEARLKISEEEETVLRNIPFVDD